MEKDRFMNELEDADKWTMLAMLQAITVYILLRIFDQDSFSVDFDRELVSAMTVRYLPQPLKRYRQRQGTDSFSRKSRLNLSKLSFFAAPR